MNIAYLWVATLGGFVAGFGFADLEITWKQKHHISIDALFMFVMALIIEFIAFTVKGA